VGRIVTIEELRLAASAAEPGPDDVAAAAIRHSMQQLMREGYDFATALRVGVHLSGAGAERPRLLVLRPDP
jgi:hypothetical protein